MANSESTDEFSSQACGAGNATECAEEVGGQEDFLDTIRSVDAFTFEGAPDPINVIWLSVITVLLVAALLTIVFSFLPLYSE